MAKTSIKAKCDSVISNEKTSSVRFIVGGEIIPAAKPGEQPTRGAKTVVQMMFTDSESATKFKVKSDYTITIEG